MSALGWAAFWVVASPGGDPSRLAIVDGIVDGLAGGAAYGLLTAPVLIRLLPVPSTARPSGA